MLAQHWFFSRWDLRGGGFEKIRVSIFPQCPKWAKWSSEIYCDTGSWKQQQHLQLTARKKPFSDLKGHDKQASVVLVSREQPMYIVLVRMLILEEHTSLVSPEPISTYLILRLVPASYPPKLSLGPNINLIG